MPPETQLPDDQQRLRPSSALESAQQDGQPLLAQPPGPPPASAANAAAAVDEHAAVALLFPSSSAPGRRRWDERARTTVLINLASIMELVDEQLLPALFSRVGASFHADPEHLGRLTFARAVVQALASPLAGLLGHYVDRVACIAAGAAIWGAMCLGFATTHSVAQGLAFWAVNGIGLALLIPAAQSLTADYNACERRGRAFGLLHLTGAVGALLGALFATNVGHARPLGFQGWRFAFGTVAAASWAIGAATWLWGKDPRYSTDPRYRADKAADVHRATDWRAILSEMASVLRTPSFLIIVLQGILGTTPWLALVWITLYLQLLGMSDLQASLVMASFLGANAAGGLIGGLLGDWAVQRWRNHGRVFVCRLSVSLGVPLSGLLFKGMPLSASPWAALLYAFVLVCTGLTITWAATACNNPIFSEIVPQHMRQLIYSFDRSFEGAVAACAAPLVGWLAREAFGFSGNAEVGTDPAANLAKARSLGSALLSFTAIPWALCAILFTPLHWTYPKDRRRAEEQAAEAHAVAEALLAAPAAADIELAPAEGLDWSASSGGDAEEKLQPARTDSAAQPPPTKA